MKTLLRSISGVLALLSLLLVVLRMQAISGVDTATVKEVLGVIFPLSVFLLFGYIAIKGRMPFTSWR
jgi:hypothetical protein